MSRSRQFRAVALCIALCLSAVSCKTSDDAKALAGQLTTTAASLCDYYSTLSGIAAEHAKLERLQQATMGVPFDKQDLAQLQDVENELQKRADAAHALADLGSAFSGLTGSTAPADVATSADNLGTELSSIQQLPGASYAPTVLQKAGQLLTQFAQERDERKMAKQMEPTLNALSEAFSQEKGAYDSINRTYIGLAQAIALDLLNKNQVDPGSLVEPALKPFGLASRMPSANVPQGLQDYAKEQIQSEGEAEIAAHAKASDTLETALKNLAQNAHQVAAGQPVTKHSLSLSSVESWAQMDSGKKHSH